MVEVLLYLISISLIVVWMKTIDKKISFITVLFAFVMLIIHLITGFIRWQFYLLYVSYVLLLLFIVMSQFGFNFQNGFKKVTAVLMGIGVVVSMLVNLAFPIYELPDPTGEYLVGTTEFYLDDVNREELYSEEEYRRFMIQVWYPAETVDGHENAPWLEGGRPLARSLASDNYLPSFALDHAVSILSNSYYDAPISSRVNDYPVVIISHGWRGFKTLHTDFAEELASHGYIVVSIDHTYGSVATVFDEEDVAYLNLDALPPRDSNDNFLDDANDLVSTYSGDIVHTIDFLEELNLDRESEFYNKLDVESIGLLGHSTGGGAGVMTALNDDRVSAVFGLDPWVEPIGYNDLMNDVLIPVFVYRSESWETGKNNDYLYTFYENNSNISMYQVNGTTHYDFAMVYMYSPLVKTIGFTGSVDSEYLTELLRDSMTQFFDVHLSEDLSELDLDEWEELELIIP